MTTLSLLIATFVLSLTSVRAQITITESSLAGIGTSLIVHEQTVPRTLSVGSDGENQSWDLTGIEFDRTRTWDILDPAETQWGNDFPDATHCIRDYYSVGDDYYFYRLEPTQFVEYGNASAFEPSNFVYYYPEKVVFPLPLSFQSSNWTSVSQFVLPIDDEVSLTQRDSIISDIDGWGTLVTDYGTHDVIRVFSHHWTTSYFTGDPPTTIHIISYSWIDAFGNTITKMSALASDTSFTNAVAKVYEVETIVDSPEQFAQPGHYELQQNYPNPFNPETSIRFDLVENSIVNLTIYNVAGQEVANLVNGNLAAGSHTVNFDGTNLTSGVYLYRLTTGSFTAQKKMVLLK